MMTSTTCTRDFDRLSKRKRNSKLLEATTAKSQRRTQSSCFWLFSLDRGSPQHSASYSTLPLCLCCQSFVKALRLSCITREKSTLCACVSLCVRVRGRQFCV